MSNSGLKQHTSRVVEDLANLQTPAPEQALAAPDAAAQPVVAPSLTPTPTPQVTTAPANDLLQSTTFGKSTLAAAGQLTRETKQTVRQPGPSRQVRKMSAERTRRPVSGKPSFYYYRARNPYNPIERMVVFLANILKMLERKIFPDGKLAALKAFMERMRKARLDQDKELQERGESRSYLGKYLRRSAGKSSVKQAASQDGPKIQR